MDPTGITVFRQGDIGEYLREVRSLFVWFGSMQRPNEYHLLTFTRKIHCSRPKGEWRVWGRRLLLVVRNF